MLYLRKVLSLISPVLRMEDPDANIRSKLSMEHEDADVFYLKSPHGFKANTCNVTL